MRGCSSFLVQLGVLAVFVYFAWKLGMDYTVQHGDRSKLFGFGFAFGGLGVLAFNLAMFGFGSLVRSQRER